MLVLSGLFVWHEEERGKLFVWHINPHATKREMEVGEVVEIDPPVIAKHGLVFKFAVVVEESPGKMVGRQARLRAGFKSRTYAELWAKKHVEELVT